MNGTVRRALVIIIFSAISIFFFFEANQAESIQYIRTGGSAFKLEYRQLSGIDLSESTTVFLTKFQSKMKPGMTLGFCEDAGSGKTRGIFTPPLLQVKMVSGLQVVIDSNKLNESVSVDRADEELSSLGIVTESDTISIETLLKKDWINQISSSTQMIGILRRIKRTVRISIRSLYQELVKNDLIEADISIEDFFKFLIENRFISVEQTKKIFEFLASKNIFLSERVDTVFELFDQYNIFIEINTSSLFEILDRLDITLSIESELFQEIVSRVLISLDFSIDEIISLFRHLNIKSKLSVEKFNRIIGNLRHIFNLTIDRIKKDVASDGVLSEISARQSKLRLEQEVNRRIVKIGDELRYTIRYSNFGEEDASRVLLIQVLPPGADYFGKKKKKNLEYVVLENGLKCLVWNIGKKLKSGSKPREVEYQIRVNDFNSGHK